jgi:hypothetical protein
MAAMRPIFCVRRYPEHFYPVRDGSGLCCNMKRIPSGHRAGALRQCFSSVASTDVTMALRQAVGNFCVLYRKVENTALS